MSVVQKTIWTHDRPTRSGWYWYKCGIITMPICLTEGGEWLSVIPFDKNVGWWSMEELIP